MTQQTKSTPKLLLAPIYLFTAASLLLLVQTGCSSNGPPKVTTSATVVYGGYWGHRYYRSYRTRPPGWVGPPGYRPPGYRPPGYRPPGIRPPRPVQLPTVPSNRRRK